MQGRKKSKSTNTIEVVTEVKDFFKKTILDEGNVGVQNTDLYQNSKLKRETATGGLVIYVRQ